MKIHALAAVMLLLLTTLSACKKEELSSFNATLEQEVSLKHKQTALFNAAPYEAAPVLSIQLEDVKDSRCPGDMVCITYGEARVSLRVSIGDENSRVVPMCLGDCDSQHISSDTAEITLNGATYLIRLLGVNPYPKDLRESSRNGKAVKMVVSRI